MLLTIYDKAGTKRADVAVNDSSTQSKEVQGDNVLSLSFSYYAFLPLDVNDYTDYLGERYWLTERYTPKQVSDGEWEYNLKLYGIESLIKRFLVLETTDGDTNPPFHLAACLFRDGFQRFVAVHPLVVYRDQLRTFHRTRLPVSNVAHAVIDSLHHHRHMLAGRGRQGKQGVVLLYLLRDLLQLVAAR